jgi:hypothetical protein
MKAPWDDEQLEMLRLRQGDTRKHPYTHTCGAILTPTHSGWICLKCPGKEVNMPGFGKAYGFQVVQDWCHDEDLTVSQQSFQALVASVIKHKLCDGSSCPRHGGDHYDDCPHSNRGRR